MKDQPITSKFTSVNSSKLPRIYNHIDWSQLKYDKVWCKNAFSHYQTFGTPLIVYDWGCGRYPEVVGDFLKCKNIKYIGYDPYWYPDGYRNYPDEGYGFPSADVFICSNVLNVICDWTEVKRISQMLRNQYRPFFITVYEGTKSYIGQETRKDCWQWNKPIESYIMNHKDVIKKKVLTNEKYKSYII